MFNTGAEIELHVRLASVGGARTPVSVRWPTDEEWVAYRRAHKGLIRYPGRGITETVPDEPNEADLKLFKAISLNGAPEVTAAEAFSMFKTMNVTEVAGVTIEGAQATVEMNILTGRSVHVLKVPTADQILKWRRGYYKILQLPYNMQQVQTSILAAAALYDECGGKSADYEGAIPGVHKEQVAMAVIDHIERELGPKPDEANF